MKTIRIVRYDAGEPAHLHRVQVPTPSEPGFYRSVMSYSAWANHWYGRAYKNAAPEAHYHTWLFEDEWELDLRFGDRAYGEAENPLRLIPSTEHGSIWDFYTAISWDYRRKKFVNEIRRLLLTMALERLQLNQRYVCDALAFSARELGAEIRKNPGKYMFTQSVVNLECEKIREWINTQIGGKFSLASWLIEQGYVAPGPEDVGLEEWEFRNKLDLTDKMRETRIAWVSWMLANW